MAQNIEHKRSWGPITFLATILVGLISIFAMFYAPIVALQVQEKKEELREKNQRKANIFRTLMTTRGDILSPEHVRALNMILLDFNEDQNVINSWQTYLDHVSHVPSSQILNTPDWLIWVDKSQELLVDLLFNMGTELGYTFDKVNLKRSFYYPKGVFDSEQQNNIIKNGLLDIISGKRSIKIEVEGKNEIKQ